MTVLLAVRILEVIDLGILAAVVERRQEEDTPVVLHIRPVRAGVSEVAQMEVVEVEHFVAAVEVGGCFDNCRLGVHQILRAWLAFLVAELLFVGPWE